MAHATNMDGIGERQSDRQRDEPSQDDPHDGADDDEPNTSDSGKVASKKPSFLSRFFTKIGLDTPTLIHMFKSVLPYRAYTDSC